MFDTFINFIPQKILLVLGMICLHSNQKACVTCIFDGVIKTERLHTVTGDHVHCTSGNISEMLPDSDVVTTDNGNHILKF